MSAIAMTGGLTMLFSKTVLDRILLPLVALAAGTLLGGAFFHMLPQGMASLGPVRASAWLLAGFTVFLLMEQFLHWHHSHRGGKDRPRPVTYLVLLGDGMHNFLGGLGIGSTFMLNPQAGVVAWVAAAAHELPQELGDFGVLVHGGWSRRRALLYNGLSALSFPLGALLAYAAASRFDVAALVLFGAGNFLYIAASDLIPEIKAQARIPQAMFHLAFFIAGLLFTYGLALWLQNG